MDSVQLTKLEELTKSVTRQGNRLILTCTLDSELTVVELLASMQYTVLDRRFNRSLKLVELRAIRSK